MRRTVLHGGTILAGADAAPVEGGVAISDGRIVEVGADVAARDGDERLDLRGRVVLPGLMDAHCHLIYHEVADPYTIELSKSIAEATADAVYNAGKLLDKGFTTVRDVGSRGNIGVAVRDAIRDGRARGPRVFAAGRIISAPGGLGDLHPTHIFENREYRDSLCKLIVGPWEARAVVRQQLKDGVDWIKVGLSGTGFNPLCPAERDGLSAEEFDALVDEARVQEVPVVAHAESALAIKKAAAAGVGTIEHGIYIDDEAVELMLEGGVVLSPTLSMYTAFVEQGAELGIPDVIVEEHKRTHEHHLESVRRAHEAGVPIVAGGDAGLTHFPQGSCAVEMASYVKLVGMSPGEALATITRNIAELLGIAGEVGTVEPGKQADLLVLDGNPLDDPDLLASDAAKVAVFQAGRIVAGGLD